MPVDLPVRKILSANAADVLDQLGVIVAALLFAVVLVGLLASTPKTYRDGLSAAVYEAMLQSP